MERLPGDWPEAETVHRGFLRGAWSELFRVQQMVQGDARLS